MVRTTRSRGMAPFVATFLPQRPGGRRAFAVNTIVPANEKVRAMVAEEGAVLVDLYPAFDNLDTLIGPDGLHPTEEGYQRIAETFFDQIRAKLEGPLPIAPVFVRHMPVPNMPGMERINMAISLPMGSTSTGWLLC